MLQSRITDQPRRSAIAFARLGETLQALPATEQPLALAVYPTLEEARAPRFSARPFLAGPPMPAGSLSATVARLRDRAAVLAFEPIDRGDAIEPLNPTPRRIPGHYTRRVEVGLLGLAALFFVAQLLRAYVTGRF